MELGVIKEKAVPLWNRYKYAVLVVAVGIVLMLLPSAKGGQSQEETVQEVTRQTESDLAEELEQILSRIDGAGEVKVLLSVAAGEETVYQQDENTDASGSVRKETVIAANSALTKQINPERYQGAIIVCQGADRAQVRLSIIEAVAKVTGLGTDRITVLKMK